LPPGSKRDLLDPYAEKKRPWGFYIFIVILIAIGWIGFKWVNGDLDRRLPKSLKHETYFMSGTWFEKKPAVEEIQVPPQDSPAIPATNTPTTN
jgi:hypothetical protein